MKRTLGLSLLLALAGLAGGLSAELFRVPDAHAQAAPPGISSGGTVQSTLNLANGASITSDATNVASNTGFLLKLNNTFDQAGELPFVLKNNTITIFKVDVNGSVYGFVGAPLPFVHAGNTTAQQSFERGTQALTAGAATVTFGNAYAANPYCVCTDQTATAAVKCSTSTTTLTIAGTSTDTIAYICLGNH